jgi:hypothetical protein
MGVGIADGLKRWWSDRAAALEVDALGAEMRRSLAQDVGTTEKTLTEIVARGSQAGAELRRLLEAVRLNPDELSRAHPSAMRQMQITCSSCAVSGACRRSLEAGEARRTFRLYCPNTYAIAALQGGGWWQEAKAETPPSA